MASYDEDAKLCVDLLLGLRTCTGKVGATGMCLGGHLAFRCALDPRVSSAICYFATGKLYSLCKEFLRVSEEFGLIWFYKILQISIVLHWG